MRKPRASRIRVSGKTTDAPAVPGLADRLWVRLLLALWVIGITAYYLHLQLARWQQITGR